MASTFDSIKSMELDSFKPLGYEPWQLREKLAIDYSKILLERTAFSFEQNNYVLILPHAFAEIAVQRADALIAELKKEKKNDETKN